MNDFGNGNHHDATGSDIDPAILAELTRALLPYLGPYSITTMKRASRATSDPAELVRQVALHIDDETRRDLFEKHARRILANVRPTTMAPAPKREPAHVSHTTGGRPATPITPELMKRGEAALAPIIGPLAAVLVSRYANAAENSRDFFDRLAGHLRSAEERDTFFQHIRASGMSAH